MNKLVTTDHNSEDVTSGHLSESPMSANVSLAVSLARAEVDQQVATSRALPRSIQRAVSNIMTLATLDEETAEECFYAVPRGGKTIRGPSVRFAEIVASQWGNCRVGARIVHVDRIEQYVEAEGVFHDLETNVAQTARVRRTIQAKRGKGIDNDMIALAGAAACSIARRNAILSGVPKGVHRKAQLAVEEVIRGDVKTLSERRGRAIKAFGAFGVTPARVFEAIGVVGEDDITLDHLTDLTGMRSALKNGEATVEEMFPMKANGPSPKTLGEKLDKLAEVTPAHDPETGEIAEPTSSGDGEIPPAKSEVEAGEANSTAASPAENKPITAAGIEERYRAMAGNESSGAKVMAPLVQAVYEMAHKAPEKPADGHPQAEASTQPAKAEAQPTQGATPAPSTPEEYRAHVLAYVAEATSASALEAKWRAKDIAPGDKMGDRSLRQKLNIDQETFSELEGIVKARCVELKGAPT